MEVKKIMDLSGAVKPKEVGKLFISSSNYRNVLLFAAKLECGEDCSLCQHSQ